MITVTEAADQLLVSPATIRRRIAAGELQAKKVGRAWVITDPAIGGALERKNSFFAKPPSNVSTRVRTKGQALYDQGEVKLLAHEWGLCWLFVVTAPKPHLVAMTFTEEKNLSFCDCEWMRANPDVPCSHLYAACLYILDMGGEEAA